MGDIDYNEPVQILWHDGTDIDPGAELAPPGRPIDCTLAKAIHMIVEDWPRTHGKFFSVMLRDDKPAITTYAQAREIYERDDFPVH
ncbi:hypothetical protein [Methylobacterium planeticum]|uniref:Uncharacterized protein n=1 Tax=Methylobacterium planeticum TaxID=2615211 RepID=A0A6N6MX44_9HYPH|nr:hypothetical protein [Methylobacterium planeticum]KAB1075469.1 hypothetical protein F6X51_01920 [Methylobacterium planeticum]